MVGLILALASARDAPTVQAQLPAVQVQQPPPRPRPTTVVVTASKPGYGDMVATDARVTVHFLAKDAQGNTLADTERRGMAFTFLMDQPLVEDFWHDAVRGMRAGGTKTLMTPASAMGIALAGDPTVTLTIRVVKVDPL